MDRLRAYWDLDDLDGTERRFRTLRDEALTQLARVEGARRISAGPRSGPFRDIRATSVRLPGGC